MSRHSVGLRPLRLALASSLGLLVLSPGAAWSQTPGPAASGPPPFDQGTFNSWSVVTDNDVYPQVAKNEDRNYTAGLGFVFAGSFVRKARLAAPLHLLDRALRVSAASGFDNQYYSISLIGTGFTPDMLNERAVIVGDRPYGSVVALGVRRQMVSSANKDQVITSELQVGMLGLSAARRIQSGLHEHLRNKSKKETPYAPLGWHNQISDGGELTGLYRVSYDRFLLGSQTGDPDVAKVFQSSWGARASAGYYTDITGNVSARFGRFYTDFWEFASGPDRATPQAARGERPQQRREVFLFAALKPRLVGYNALLQGQFKESVYTVTPKRLQMEWDLGAAFFIPFGSSHGIGAAYSFAPGRTSEFVGGKSRAHGWGSLVVTVAHSPKVLQ